jgi:hypothetical protein
MAHKCASDSVNQGANRVAIAAKYLYAEQELVGTNIIAVITTNSLLSSVSQSI